MEDPDQSPDVDLSGPWQGLYSYPRLREPVPFSALLKEADGWIDGSIEEIGEAGEARGRVLSATVQGRRNGRAITFLKLYDGGLRGYDSVHYQGEVSPDGVEIEGRWVIAGVWSGQFLMIRSGRSFGADARRALERLDVKR